MNRLNLIIAFVFCFRIHAQVQKVLIRGTVRSNDLSVENIHILNLTSHKGSLTDSNGVFTITVKEHDTLMISGIQFGRIKLIIDKKITERKEITIDLTNHTRKLDEIVLLPHDLSGNLFFDSTNHKDTLTIKGAPLNLGNIDFHIPSLSVAKQLDPDNVSVQTDQSIPVGGDIIGLVNFILGDPLGKLAKKKRRKESFDPDTEKIVLNNIRETLGDQFFIRDLHIIPKKIDEFILSCKSKGIVNLFLKNRKLELIDVLIAESKLFTAKR